MQNYHTKLFVYSSKFDYGDMLERDTNKSSATRIEFKNLIILISVLCFAFVINK